MTISPRDQEILAINQAMLESVAAGDWENYSQVCSPEISCFEAESEGHLVEGHAFHRYYFDLASQSPKRTDSRQRHHGSASPALAQRRCSRGELHPINSNNPQRRTHHIPLLRDKDMATKRRNLVTSARSPLLKPEKRKEGSSVERHVASWEAFLRKNSQQKSHLMMRWLLRGW